MSRPAKSSGAPLPPNVFIVEDDPSLRRLLILQMRTAGYSPEAFESAEAFLSVVTPSMHGVLLLDIQLPGISGTELQTLLRERAVHLPIIFLSGTANVPITAAAMKLGAMDVIEKPVDSATLLNAVRSALLKSEQTTAIAQLRASLTSRELEVADLIADGLSNKQIARSLCISDRTVEIHKSRVMAKMKSDNLASFLMKWTTPAGKGLHSNKK